MKFSVININAAEEKFKGKGIDFYLLSVSMERKSYFDFSVYAEQTGSYTHFIQT
jgi:hypothetical protein